MPYRIRSASRALSALALLAFLAAPENARAAAIPPEQCPAVPPMDDVASVTVETPQPRVEREEAFNDCCVLCEHQSLEALVPTPHGPQFLEPDGGLPLRQKFCGTVVRYGVNDELDDARDLMLNIVPKPGFEHFVEGFVNTECTPLDDAQEDLFGHWDSECPVGKCLMHGHNPEDAPTDKCLHAELTPVQQFYDQDFLFLPITDSGDHPCAGDHPVFGSYHGWDCNSSLEPPGKWIPPGPLGLSGREACVFGVYAMDHGPDHRASDHRELCCSPDPSHDRPEIHPFDGLWFRHPNPGKRGWVFGAFQDDSNRYSFPHCGSENNDNTWSQAPRDLTYRFPFKLPRTLGPMKACLHPLRTQNFDGNFHDIRQINVTTAFMDNPLVEVKKLHDGGGQLVLEAVEPDGAEDEAQVRIEGCVTATEISGWVTVRVAVGCPPGMSCPGINDPDDPGSGLYYSELTFERDCYRGTP